MLPNLSEAMLYSGRTERGLELAEKIKSPVVQTGVYMTHAYILFYAGKQSEARAALDAHASRTAQRVRVPVQWALNAYQRGDPVRGDAAMDLAREILKDHETATGEAVRVVSLPSAIAASGEIGTAIEMVREIPELRDRARAAFLLTEILANDPDADRAKAFMRQASAWRASLDPMEAQAALIEEAWGWLMLGEIDQAIRIAEEVPAGERRNSTLAFLLLNAGESGRTKDALMLADHIDGASEKAWALAQCAQAGFTFQHHDTADACLEATRELIPEVMNMAERGGLDDGQARNIDLALEAAANVESLAGNDAAVVDIMSAAGIATVGMDDKIISAHISAGDHSLAMLLAFQDADALKQARALSSLARALARKEFTGE
ncbi:hypothetical protein [Roseibium sp. MMSF_3412]|uniref:hypothetical protein n=1 Tax=Roseibium sp. MMSF_3412 TaxID=3046712 RepID=UPI00273F6F00|nr:hypothetical protein [Roseibium sp. MMSF_3412]